MSDVSLEWPADSTLQGDFGVSSDGDILVCSGDTETRQRITRRWLTNQRAIGPDGSLLQPDYIFDPNYGAGLRRTIGQAINPTRIEALKQVCRDGCMQEDTVSAVPPPEVFVQSPAPGVLSAFAIFTSTISQKPVSTPRVTLS